MLTLTQPLHAHFTWLLSYEPWKHKFQISNTTRELAHKKATIMKKPHLPMRRRMASSKPQKGLRLDRKLSVLRAMTRSKSVSEEGIIADTVAHIASLMRQIESLERDLVERQGIKVEKAEQGFKVGVSCELQNGFNPNSMIASVFQVFDNLNLNVAQASIACHGWFSVKASVLADHDRRVNALDLTRALNETVHLV
uniref:Plant bHLH transcription factor ACT-like domain-containing protein n=1 Tax=Kalanchoe fedtschenkoi TaxID=63787 RepID=A0A7N0T4H4_KALFE